MAVMPIVPGEGKPAFAVRGFMLDVSRGKVPTRRQLAELIQLLGRLRYNHFQLYIEHTFAFAQHRRVWRGASPLTAADIRWVEALCDRQGLEFSANFNSFGHFERWLKHPQYKHLAECPEGFEHPIKGRMAHGTTLRPNTASLRFLDQLWKEYLPLFKSKRFNLGGDEPWELGLGWSKKQVEKHGKHRVYLDFLKKLHRQTAKHGKEMLFWGDILLESPELVKEVPKDATALLWGYEANHPFAEQCARMAKSGRKFWVCPGTSAWNTFTGRTDNMLTNLESAAKHGLANGAEGMLLTSWGDGGNHQPWAAMYPGLVYAAGLAWNQKGAKREDLPKAINQLFENDWLGDSLLEIGRAESDVKTPKHNCSRHHSLFFATRAGLKKELETLSIPELKGVAARLQKARRRLPDTKLQPWNLDSAADHELRLGLDMAAWAIKRGLAAKAGRKATGLKAELHELIACFEKAWRWHGRPGGLPEAVARMRAVEKEL